MINVNAELADNPGIVVCKLYVELPARIALYVLRETNYKVVLSIVTEIRQRKAWNPIARGGGQNWSQPLTVTLNQFGFLHSSSTTYMWSLKVLGLKL